MNGRTSTALLLATALAIVSAAAGCGTGQGAVTGSSEDRPAAAALRPLGTPEEPIVLLANYDPIEPVSISTIHDWKAHHAAIAVVRVRSEREQHLRDRREAEARGEGMITRWIEVEVEELLWQQEGAELPDRFGLYGSPWWYQQGELEPFRWGLAWEEVGGHYLLVIGRDTVPHDDTPEWWANAKLTLPVVDGRTPSVYTDVPALNRLGGHTVAELHAILAAG